MPNISCVDNNGQKLEQQRSSSISSNPFQFVKCSGSQDLTHTAETQLEMSENLMNLRHSQSFDGADSDCEWQLVSSIYSYLVSSIYSYLVSSIYFVFGTYFKLESIINF